MKNARNQHRTDYAKELVKIVQTTKDREELKKKIAAYHERDIANAIVESDKTVRKCIYDILDIADIAEIFSYIEEEPGKYLEEMPIEQAAKVVSNMDSDDAMDLFEELNEEDKYKLLKRLDKEAKEDVQKLLSYEEDQIGSCMTNNYIVVRNDVTIREAMSTLVKQAGEHDNIQTLYVIDENGIFAGAIDLKDLIIAREHDNLQDIISSSYPYVYEHEKISECMEILTDYEEDSIPVLTQDKKIAGILTSSDIVELVDDEMGDDYAKLAGLTEEEDLNEPTIVSMKKRLPWLIALLFLGMAVSSVVGMFETVVAILPIVICFQSLVLDMAGNVGTQSLAVTIRVLMDEKLTGKEKLMLLIKEVKVGLLNGMILGIMALFFFGTLALNTILFSLNLWKGKFVGLCVVASLIFMGYLFSADLILKEWSGWLSIACHVNLAQHQLTGTGSDPKIGQSILLLLFISLCSFAWTCKLAKNFNFFIGEKE